MKYRGQDYLIHQSDVWVECNKWVKNYAEIAKNRAYQRAPVVQQECVRKRENDKYMLKNMIQVRADVEEYESAQWLKRNKIHEYMSYD